MTDTDRLSALERFRDSVEGRLQTLERKDAVDDVHRTNVETRLGSIEDTLKWLVRLIIGALLMAALAWVIRGGFAPI